MTSRTVSAVMATRNRPDDVRRSLPTLLATNADAVVVVDQSTDDQTKAVVDELADSRVTYVHSTERGVSRARNRAFEACSTDILAFTDDDCTVPPTWTDDIRSIMGAQGYELLFLPVLAPTDRSGLDGWIPEYKPRLTGPVPPDCDPIESFGFTANMAVTAALAKAVGPFDEWLGPGSKHNIGGEDTDFGYRAVRAGFRVGVELSPAVTHYGVKAGDAFESTRRTYQRGAGAFLDKHTRLGDPVARRREVAGFSGPLRQAGGNVVHLRRPSGLGVARSFLAGILTARRHYLVDPETKLYVPR